MGEPRKRPSVGLIISLVIIWFVWPVICWGAVGFLIWRYCIR